MVSLLVALTLAHAGDPVQIVTGEDFSCQRDNGGTVSCWGNNEDRQLGLDPQIPHMSLPTANGVTNVADLSASGPLACAVTHNGAVLCWGQAEVPAWGKGIAPKRVLGLQDVAAVSVRAAGGCVRHRGGAVSCWDNTHGELNEPIRQVHIGFVEQIAVGRAHACARVQGGEVWCWGDDRRGQLGQATSGWPSTAVNIPNLHQIVDIASGGDVTCATTRTGQVWCWGSNRDGNLGVGNTDPLFGPQRVPELTEVIQVSIGNHETCALTRKGDVHCWGVDPCPRPDAPTRRLTPVAQPIHNAKALSTGGQSDHKCALTPDGPRCWGFNSHGQALSDNRCVSLEDTP